MNKRKIIRIIQKLLLVVIIFGGIYGGLRMYVHYRVMNTVEKVTHDIESVVDFRYGNIESSIDGSFSFTDVTFEVVTTGDVVNIDSVTVDNGDLLGLYEFVNEFSANRTPRYYNFQVHGFSFGANSRLVDRYLDALNLPNQVFPPTEKLLNCGDIFRFDQKLIVDLGYSGSAMDFSLVVDLRSSTFKLAMNILYPDHTELAIKTNFDAEQASTGRVLAASNLKLKDFEMVLKPGSFLEESMKYCMSKEKATEEQVRDAFLRQFEQRMTDLRIKPDNDMLREYRKFLTTSSRLVVTANPIEPLDLATLEKYDPVDVPGLLNMGFVVN